MSLTEQQEALARLAAVLLARKPAGAVGVEDQERFPRDEANQPEWLKARLAQVRPEEP